MDTTLVRGHGGVFEVSVDGKVVAKKTPDGFPSERAIVDAVKAALSG